MINPTILRKYADIIARQHGEDDIFVEALREAAHEIDLLNLTVEAAVKLAVEASKRSVADRQLLEDVRNRNTELHNEKVLYRHERDEALDRLAGKEVV